MNKVKAESLKEMLLQIYPCKHPFELKLIDKKMKTRMGSYSVHNKVIRIYTPFKEVTPLEEIAIHEYAHHVHETEKRKHRDRRKERSHGAEFWRIYSALMSVAIQKGIFSDPYIQDLVKPLPPE